MAAAIFAGPESSLIRHVELSDWTAFVRVNQHCWHHVFKLLLLKHWDHKDATVVCTNDGRRRVFVLEYEVGCDFFISEEKAELA